MLREHCYHIAPSIGVSLFQGPGEMLNELLQRADMAMYQAKAAGRNIIRFFDPIISGQNRLTADSA